MSPEMLNGKYFEWLANDAYANSASRMRNFGLMLTLHDIPFYWTMWSDENRAGDALAFRQSDFLSFYPQEWLEQLDKVWLGQWATASPSVLEVLLGMCRRWSFYYEMPTYHFFNIMTVNLGLSKLGKMDDSKKDYIRHVVDNWMSRQYTAAGLGSPFPVASHSQDMRKLDIWAQMNAYSAEHFQ